MSTGTKAIFVCCVLLVAVGLFHRANLALEPDRPRNMPENSRFIPTGYDLEHNEAQGTWVSCASGVASNERFCRVTDAYGTVVFQGAFLPVRDSESAPSEDYTNARSALAWVNGPIEGSPVPVIAITDGSMLVPRDDRDALIDRWNTHHDEWRRLQAME